MQRREFLASTATGLTALAASSSLLHAAEETATSGTSSPSPFKLKYAPHFGMFRHHASSMTDQLKFAADEGFTAWEDNSMGKRSVKVQEELAKTMDKVGIEMGVFVAYSGFGKNKMVSTTDKGYQEGLRKHMKKMIEVAKRVNAKWCTIVPGNVNTRLEHDYQMANCVENLRVMAEVCEPAGLVMVLEPLNWYADHPGLFLTKVPQAYLICKAVGSPSCKVLDDLYHQQVSEGNLIANINLAWDEIAYYQVGDNPGRKEPTTGEVNYKNIFRHLHRRGFKGIVGMEHGNSQKGKAGERAVIDAYRECDSFE